MIWKSWKISIWNPKSPLLVVCHSLMAILCAVAFVSPSLKSEIPLALSVSQTYGYVSLLCGRGCIISTSSYVKYFLPGLNRGRLTIRPKILFVPRMSQQYGYVSLLCGRICVVSITSYVDYFTRVKSSETNDMTLPWWHLEWLGI